MVADAALEQLATTAGVQPIVRIRTSKVEALRAAVVADGAQADLAGPDVIEVAGLTPERVGQLAADRRIPVFESVTDAANLEEIFFQLTAGESEGATR